MPGGFTKRRITAIACIAAAYVAAAYLGFALSPVDDQITAVWPPTGIALAALLLWGRGMWPGIAIGAFSANLIDGAPIHIAAAIAVGNTLAPVVASVVLERVQIRPSLARLRDVIGLIFIGGLGAMTISATLGTAVLAAGGAPWSVEKWMLWWVGDAMGVILLAPFILTLCSGRVLDNMLWRRRRQAIVLLGAFTASTILAVVTDSPVGFLVIPLALWASIQLEQQGAAAAALLMTIIDVGHRVISERTSPTLDTDLMALQGVNATIAFILLAIAAIMHERRKAQEKLMEGAAELEHRVDERTRELVEANEHIRESEQRLAQAQRLASIGSFQWDAASDTNDWSDELFRIYGLSPKDGPPGMEQYLSFVRADMRERVSSAVQLGIANQEPFSHEYPIILADGTEKWVHAYVEVLHNNGILRGLRGTCQDVTQRKEAEVVLRTALDREREAAEHLRRLDQSKNAFLSAVSHELRTPLTAILGFAELLQEPDVRRSEEMSSDLVERLGYSAKRLADLLSDLLDVDRLQRGIIEPRRRSALLRDLVERALGTLDLRSHPLRVDVDDAIVTVDPAQTERIIENLVTNAVKYTPNDTEIFVRAQAGPDGGVHLTVEDTGPGIDHDLRKSVFEPFVRGDTGTFSQGTGIGLALVERFARLHGGFAWVDEGPDGGASFHVDLPGPPAAETAAVA